MSDKKTVVVPIDGSAFSQQVLPHLGRFLDPSQTKIILLRVAKAGAHTITSEDEEERESLPLMISGATAYTQVRPSMPKSGPDTASLEGSVYASQIEEQTVQAIVDSLQPVKKQLEAEGYGVEIAARLGEPTTRIVEFLNEEHVDLVAMTTHCRSGLGRVFLGSVAQYVIHHAGVPIFLVRPCVR